jgi:tripartite-type tricarboxylate transporter receptor subunit TctC
MPRPIVDRLQKEFAKALQLPDVKASLAAFSAEPVGSTPEAFAQTVKSEIVKYDKVVKDANIKLDLSQ